MTTDFDAEISSQLDEARAIQQECETIVERLIDEGANVLTSLWPMRAREVVTSQAASGRELSTDQIAAVKREVETLVQDARRVVAQELEKDEHWPHRKPIDVIEREQGGRPYSANLGYDFTLNRHQSDTTAWGGGVVGPLTAAAAVLDAVLRKHGVIDEDPWGRNAPLITGMALRQAITDEFEAEANSYAETADRLGRVAKQLSELRSQKRKTEAADVWDEA